MALSKHSRRYNAIVRQKEGEPAGTSTTTFTKTRLREFPLIELPWCSWTSEPHLDITRLATLGFSHQAASLSITSWTNLGQSAFWRAEAHLTLAYESSHVLISPCVGPSPGKRRDERRRRGARRCVCLTPTRLLENKRILCTRRSVALLHQVRSTVRGASSSLQLGSRS